MKAFTPAPVKPVVSADGLKAFDIRVGTIVTVDDLPKSKRLVRLRVNFGDHERTILAGLKQKGIETSEATVSRRIADMGSEYGIAEYVTTTAAGKIYRKNREMESVLNLAARVERWLEDAAKAKKTGKKAR